MNTLDRVSLSASPYRTLAWPLALALLGACATKTNAELQAQSAADTRIDPESQESAPSHASSETPSAPASTPAAPPAQTYDGPSCPLHCAFVRPRSRALAPEEEERLRAALAPTMSGVRSCVYAGGSDGRYIKPPTLTLRFSDTNELLDMGVDTSSYEGSGESCFLSVVRGGASPDIRIDGPATVQCRERCERHEQRKTATKKTAKPH